MTLLPGSLLGRTALIIAVMLLAVQAVTLYLFRLYYYGPLVEETAGRAASQIGMIVSAIQVLHVEDREELLHLLETREQVRVLFDVHGVLPTQDPDDAFLQAFAQRLRGALGPDTAFFIQPRDARALWVSVGVSNERVWIGIPRAQIERPFPWWWVGWAALCAALAVLVAYVLLRRVARPLRALATASAELADSGQSSPVKLEGPREVREVATAFNGMLSDLRRQDQDRAVLLAGISHDLRTPLTRLRLGIELLEGDVATKADMVRDTEEMDVVLGQFLDFARVKAGEGFEVAPLNPLLTQCVAAFQGQGGRVRLTASAEASLRMQPVALRRAVTNLLDNALKYSGGDVELMTEITGKSVAITVLDRGPGIAAEDMERVRRPFTRLAQARTGARGAGLGLAIVERVAREHGGALRLAPRPGGGMIASIILPLQA